MIEVSYWFNNSSTHECPDALFRKLVQYDTENTKNPRSTVGNPILRNGKTIDGVLNETEIAAITPSGKLEDGMQALRDSIKLHGYMLHKVPPGFFTLLNLPVEEDSYTVVSEMNCPEGQRYIPNGEFRTTISTRTDTKIKDTSVPRFCADVTEVTGGVYAQWPHSSHVLEFSERPVVNITWESASAYCGSLLGIDGNPMRLPTEDEFRRMSKGVSGQDEVATDDGLWTTLSPEKANYAHGFSALFIRKHDLKPVGSYAANSWGLHDLAGNAAEWTANLIDGKVRGYDETKIGVVLGGDAISGRESLDVDVVNAIGFYLSSLEGDNHVGFRCVSDPTPWVDIFSQGAEVFEMGL